MEISKNNTAKTGHPSKRNRKKKNIEEPALVSMTEDQVNISGKKKKNSLYKHRPGKFPLSSQQVFNTVVGAREISGFPTTDEILDDLFGKDPFSIP